MSGLVIGITGPAGSGKTLASGDLAGQGFEVFPLDAAGHALLEEPDVKERLVEEFSTGVLRLMDGAVSRKKLGKLVFSSTEELLRLNDIIHPLLAERARSWLEEVRRKDGAGVVEGSLVYEFGFESALDGVILIDAPFDKRLERLSVSRGWDEARLRAVDAAQMDVDEKVSRGAVLVANTGSPRDLLDKVRLLLEERQWLPKKTKAT